MLNIFSLFPQSATFTPDQIEPQQPVITESPPMVRYNQAPIVKKKLKKYAVINGRSLKIQIPEDCFWDPEDGNTRNLKVDVYEENNKPLRVPWLKYDPKLQTLFALPFDENGIGRYSFNIVATDSQGLNASNYLGKFTHSVENREICSHFQKNREIIHCTLVSLPNSYFFFFHRNPRQTIPWSTSS